MDNTESKKIEIYNAICIAPSKLKPWHTFCYIDCVQYLADSLFTKYDVRPRFGKEYTMDEGKYAGIMCRVRRKHLDGFLMAMDELQRKMIICGYADYESFCRDILSALQEDDDE